MWWIAVVVIAVVVLLVIVVAIAANGKDSSDGGTYFHHDSTSRAITDWDQQEINYVGQEGENYVAKNLANLASNYNGFLFNDFCFEDEEGYSTEIDHILITRGGVFVIETKTNKGTIYGDKDDEYWDCIKKEYQEDKKLKNPIIQNQGHINHLRRVFGKNAPKMLSIIIFPIADVSNIDSNLVYDLDDAIAAIKNMTDAAKYSQEFVNRVNNQLIMIRDQYGISKQRHIDNINKKYN